MNNRVIKFRAWSISRKKWEKKMGLYFDDGQIGDFSECIHNCDNIKDYIIQQFTGFLDKNSKEIYEGDIVRYDFHYCNAIYTKVAEVGFSTLLGSFSPLPLIPINGSVQSNKNYKVIGNIFENPELLLKT